MSIFNISWEDLWAYDICPRKLAVDTRRASWRGPYLYPPKHLNDEALFANAEAETTVREPLAFKNLERQKAIPRTPVSKERLQDYAKHVVQQSVKPRKRVLEAIARKYGDVHTTGRVRARQPDMVSRAYPDFFVLTSSGERVIVEEKSRPSERNRFKARFYNGLAESNGVFVVGERWENGLPVLAPHVERGPGETLLVYPDSEEVVEEKFPVEIKLVKRVALAKQLGYQGKCPVDCCGPNCKHNRQNLKLVEASHEPLRPLGLTFCELLLREGYSFDHHYQTFYKWQLENWLEEFFQDELLEPARWSEWLKEIAFLEPEVVDDRNDMYGTSAGTLLKKAARERDQWRCLLREGLNVRLAESVLGNGRGVFALPQGSELLLRGAIERWAS